MAQEAQLRQQTTRSSRILVTFVTLLHLNLSKPQLKHLFRTADAVIVCEGRKTLANLYRQWVEAPDASALADFFHASPWEVGEINRALGPFAIDDMLQRAAEEGANGLLQRRRARHVAHSDRLLQLYFRLAALPA